MRRPGGGKTRSSASRESSEEFDLGEFVKDEEGQILGQIELCLHDRFVVKKWRDKEWYFG